MPVHVGLVVRYPIPQQEANLAMQRQPRAHAVGIMG